MWCLGAFLTVLWPQLLQELWCDLHNCPYQMAACSLVGLKWCFPDCLKGCEKAKTLSYRGNVCPGYSSSGGKVTALSQLWPLTWGWRQTLHGTVHPSCEASASVQHWGILNNEIIHLNVASRRQSKEFVSVNVVWRLYCCLHCCFQNIC